MSDLTTQANAWSTGLGPTMRVVIWDTLLDGTTSSPGEIRFVLAHELGHVEAEHVWKGLGWAILFAFPITFLLAWLTRRRGGLRRPRRRCPTGSSCSTILGLAVTPLGNVISRHIEAEADWMASRRRTTPRQREGLFQKFTRTSLAQPEPADLGVHLLRHASDGHAADRDDGGLEGPATR